MNEQGNKKPDIFDRIMSWRMLKTVQPFYQRFREQLLYLFFGGLTTFLSIFLFWLLTERLSMNALVANVIVWVICVLFAYVTNRTWVFKEKAHDTSGIAWECISFFAGRLGTLALEELVLWIGIDCLGIHGMVVKVVAQVLVIVGNYVISKWFVFRDKR